VRYVCVLVRVRRKNSRLTCPKNHCHAPSQRSDSCVLSFLRAVSRATIWPVHKSTITGVVACVCTCLCVLCVCCVCVVCVVCVFCVCVLCVWICVRMPVRVCQCAIDSVCMVSIETYQSFVCVFLHMAYPRFTRIVKSSLLFRVSDMHQTLWLLCRRGWVMVIAAKYTQPETV